MVDKKRVTGLHRGRSNTAQNVVEHAAAAKQNVKVAAADRVRCRWASNPLSIAYHDSEWGVPLHDERGLFEFLILEGAQAGLSWITILKKREAYRSAFDRFDARKVARYDDAKVAALLGNEAIVRNRLKIRAAVQN